MSAQLTSILKTADSEYLMELKVSEAHPLVWQTWKQRSRSRASRMGKRSIRQMALFNCSHISQCSLEGLKEAPGHSRTLKRSAEEVYSRV